MIVQRFSRHSTQQGFTLLEVMIALVIFSIGLLGLAGLQAGGLRSNTQAQLRTIAVIQAYDMADRIRANPRGVEDGDYNAMETAPANTVTSGDCVNNTCTAAQMATYDYYEWETANRNILPSGHGSVSSNVVSGVRLFTVTVMWDEERTGVTGTNCSGDPTVDLKCYTLVFEP